MRWILPLLFVLANLPVLDAEEEYEYNEYYEHYEDIDLNQPYMVIRNIKKCKAMDKELRKLIEKFHFNLRQTAANGSRYRDVPLNITLMNGLVYDCEYEVEAMIMTLKKKKLPDGKGMVKFNITRTNGTILEAVQAGLDSQFNETKILRQLVYPKATRFGCYAQFHTQIHLLCIYDQKAQEIELYGRYCDIDENCTLTPKTRCKWGLCYVQFGVDEI
ncbi:hypothetical protein RB195_007550 [Necator americanus]|uniref:Uncharacterized protein n=1 Tax=Necator americanus TaxID=51031 RepID=A0ABR1BXT4_NECAM